MDILNYKYVPKAAPISCMETRREVGFVGEVIHMHDHHEVNLIVSRTDCEIVNNGNLCRVRTPAIVLHRAGSFHEITKVSEGAFSSHLAFFHDDVVKGVPEKYVHADQLFGADMLVLPLSEEETDLFLPLFRQMKRREDSFEQMLFLLLCILSQMAQLLHLGHPSISSTAHETYIFDAAAVLREEMDRQLTAGELAERFHVSPSKLNSDFRKITGMTVKTFSTQVRLHRALTMLRSTDESLASIAYACGFSGESHFIGVFRKAYGQTPAAYRKAR